MKFWGQRKDEELDAEIRSHLDEAIRDRIARGETPDEARANALREFGNVGLVKEVTREMWSWAFARTIETGLAVWAADVAQESGLFAGGDSDVGAWHRCEHGNFQCCQRRAISAVALSRI